MTALLVRAALSGLIVAIVALVARRSPGLGGLIASIPLVSTLGLIWLWHDSGGDRAAAATYMSSALLFFLPSLPMFVLIPWALRSGWPFWAALGSGLALTMALYWITMRIASHWGLSV